MLEQIYDCPSLYPPPTLAHSAPVTLATLYACSHVRAFPLAGDCLEHSYIHSDISTQLLPCLLQATSSVRLTLAHTIECSNFSPNQHSLSPLPSATFPFPRNFTYLSCFVHWYIPNLLNRAWQSGYSINTCCIELVELDLERISIIYLFLIRCAFRVSCGAC